MKILHVITSLSVGGAQYALVNLLRAGLAEEGEHCVISLRERGPMAFHLEALKVPVISLGIRNALQLMLLIKNIARMLRVVHHFRPDIIQGWMYHGNLMALIIRFLAPGKPAVFWNIRHSLHRLNREKPMTRQMIRANKMLSVLPQCIIYNSRVSRKQHEHFGFYSGHGCFIPNGIDLFRFKNSEKGRRQIRSELKVPADAPVVGHIARYHPMKNQTGFLRAAVALAGQYPDAHFLLCGHNVSLEKEDLSALIPDKFRGRFHLLGERVDVPDLISAIDIFCLSSLGEAFPNVLGEAMATGVPCAVTNVGDSAEIVGHTGVIISEVDENGIYYGIEKLLIMAPDKRRSLGKSARARVESKYALEAVVSQYSRLYMAA